MKINLSSKLIVLTALIVLSFACKKESVEIPIAIFSYEVDGLTVKFTNTSISAEGTTYSWDFGDGESSTENDPEHTYADFGDYAVTLTAINKGVKDTYDENISFMQPLVVIDGDFSDWSELLSSELYTSTLPDVETNYPVLKEVKVCADRDYIYCYVELDATNVGPFSIMLDCDNNYNTGRQYYWNDAGLDVLIEASITDPVTMLDGSVYRGIGSGEDGTWEDDPIMSPGSGVVKYSQVMNLDNGLQAFEIGIIRAMLPVQIPGSSIKMCFKSNDPDWNKNGLLPLGADGTYDDVKALQVNLP